MTSVDLLNTLEDLKEDEFKKFTWYLQQSDFMEPYQAIKESKLEKANILKTVDLVVQTFELHGALEVTRKVLQKIPRNDLLPRLPNTRSGPEDDADVGETLENRGASACQSEGIENKPDRSPSLSVDQTQLEWQTFDGSLPKGAVYIYNKYVGRIDYVSKYRSVAGFYNPAMGPYCRYPFARKEHLGSPFEILVNKDDFEILEWKEGSLGEVPENSVKTISNKDIYVGKNKYGLGKMRVRHKNFFLPWKGSEYWYNDYQVLTFSKDIYSEHISDVKYKTDGAKIVKHLPETMTKATLINNGCQTATQTATLSKKSQVEQRWDSSFSFTLGVNTSITAQIPSIASVGIEFSASTTLQFTKGSTYTESKDYTVSVECNVPPKHSCSVTMVGYKYEADIPYTARLNRTYNNGETRWTSISGTYKGVQVMEVESVVGRCEPLPDDRPCGRMMEEAP